MHFFLLNLMQNKILRLQFLFLPCFPLSNVSSFFLIGFFSTKRCIEVLLDVHYLVCMSFLIILSKAFISPLKKNVSLSLEPFLIVYVLCYHQSSMVIKRMVTQLTSYVVFKTIELLINNGNKKGVESFLWVCLGSVHLHEDFSSKFVRIILLTIKL